MNNSPQATNAFSSDVAFLQEHTDVLLLQNDDATVVIAPAYQGRVMTSTFDQATGPSFGWLNRPVIERGVLSDAERAGKLEEHVHIFGGEERFWLGPEGGQFGLYFAPGSRFDFADWKTPASLDTLPFEQIDCTATSASFQHKCVLQNHSGTRFDVGVDRCINLLDESALTALHGEPPLSDLRRVGYETDNRITNRGNEPWRPETGLLSIWLLGMYNPSPRTTIVVPLVAGDDQVLGSKVNDAYFGSPPADHLQVHEDVLLFRGDGTRRGKIGVVSQRSTGIAGSYDADGATLTIVACNRQPALNGYVNSMWELQNEPYAGDMINAYNDGSPEPGAPPLGPFYELETSSPAAALKPGESMQHIQQTWHLHGPDVLLDSISRRLLNISLDRVGTFVNA